MIFFLFKTQNPCVFTLFITFLRIFLGKVQNIVEKSRVTNKLLFYIIYKASKNRFMTFRKIREGSCKKL